MLATVIPTPNLNGPSEPQLKTEAQRERHEWQMQQNGTATVCNDEVRRRLVSPCPLHVLLSRMHAPSILRRLLLETPNLLATLPGMELTEAGNGWQGAGLFTASMHWRIE